MPDTRINDLWETRHVGLSLATTPRGPNPIPRIIVTMIVNVIHQTKITIRTSDHFVSSSLIREQAWKPYVAALSIPRVRVRALRTKPRLVMQMIGHG